MGAQIPEGRSHFLKETGEEGISLFQECSLRIQDSIVRKLVSKKLLEKLKGSSFRFEIRNVYYPLSLDTFSFLSLLKSFSEEMFQLENYILSVKGDVLIEVLFSVRGRNEIFAEFFLSCSSLEELKNKASEIKEMLSNHISKKVYCSIDWMYLNLFFKEFSVRTVKEKLDDVIYKEAYPYIDLDNLVISYLKSTDPVLILYGPPGTGKTRLIRYILRKFLETEEEFLRVGVVKRQYEEDSLCRVLYTSQPEVVEQSPIFVNFLFEPYNFLVLEDIDKHLEPRSENNTAMYSLLSASNGLTVSLLEKKKIILSTNLPNVTKIDDALKRPGRCFSIVETRNLTLQESRNFLEASGNKKIIDLLPSDGTGFPLSDLYYAVNYGKIPSVRERVSGFLQGAVVYRK